MALSEAQARIAEVREKGVKSVLEERFPQVKQLTRGQLLGNIRGQGIPTVEDIRGRVQDVLKGRRGQRHRGSRKGLKGKKKYKSAVVDRPGMAVEGRSAEKAVSKRLSVEW